MHNTKSFLTLISGCLCLGIWATESTTTSITQTTTIITKTVVSETKQWTPFKVCVLDFTSIATQGQKRFLSETTDAPIIIPPQSTLNDADRKSMNSVMQGFVRLIDAWDNTKTNTANRNVQADNNAFNKEKAISLYRTIVRGQTRPMVIGADYLSAYLGKYHDTFSCVDNSQMLFAMEKLQQSPDFPKNFMLQLARETGATHLIYGTVSDIRKKTNSFKGYGIETKTANYQLDVIIKMVDLAAQGTVYSNVYTGHYREQQPVSTTQIDSNIFQRLMTAALEQAAEDLYDHCRPGRKNKIKVTPMPYTLTIVPSGGRFFKADQAEIFVDGNLIGTGEVSFLIPAGKHVIEVTAPGYKKKSFEINVAADQTIKANLEK